MLSDQLKQHGINKGSATKGSLWKGPEKDGITFSLISRWLVCRERFRLYVVEGLKTRDQWNHRLGYGNLWHACEEAHAVNQNWEKKLIEQAKAFCQQYPTSQNDVDHWYNICRLQFPLYVKYWSEHDDMKNRTPLLSEQVFNVPYTLPSGRVVRLRGKWDSVDLVKGEVWLMENKSKGTVDEVQIQRQLTRDLQVMLYLVALKEWQKQDDYGEPIRFPKAVESPIAGVRYNVVRRPLSGGKGTIVRGKATQGSKCPKCKGKKIIYDRFVCPKCKNTGRINAKPAETAEAYYKRVAEYIKDNPQDYFMRWNVNVNQDDITKFKQQCLNPILEQLCIWWGMVTRTEISRDFGTDHYNWLMPFGVYNPLLEGDPTEMDTYLTTGSTVGLQRVTNLFPELKE